MPPAATEARVLDSLLAALQAIGTPPAEWLTTPTVSEDVPSDPLAQPAATGVYLQLVGTVPREGEAGTTTHHAWRVNCRVVIVASTTRGMLATKADVVRALFNAEGTIAATLGMPAFVGDFVHRVDLAQAGYAVGELAVFVDMTVLHVSP